MSTAKEILHASEASITPERTVSVDVAQSVDDVVELMLKKDVGLVLVVEQGGTYVGVVTQKRALQELHHHGSQIPRETAMALADAQYPTVTGDSDAGSIAATMIEHGVRKLPVVDSGELVGLVTDADVARHLSDTASAGFLRELWRRRGRETDDTGPKYTGEDAL
ncbi:CBS domain-containing protein [Streptomyces sp. NPDC059949]|uniref:CBS domain-containing protein n=1 Tax=Streptomyces sp. NPDC059949 TaxID=3347013 RepID=UPI0036633C65